MYYFLQTKLNGSVWADLDDTKVSVTILLGFFCLFFNVFIC